MIKELLVSGALLLPMGIVLANDSMAEIAVGGLVFTKTTDVEMRSEELAISEESVDVLYHFYNNGTKPVTSLVAFPMPDIEYSNSQSAVPTHDPENLFGFVTTVNGKPVTARIEQKAMVGNVDYTKLLRDLHIPLAPQLKVTDDTLKRLHPKQIKLLLKAGLVCDMGSNSDHDYAPSWTLKSAYYWEQTFLPKVETIIHHHYKPAVGGSVEASSSIGDGNADPEYDKYGIDSNFVEAFKKGKLSSHAKANGYSRPWSENRIGYILKTGANWAKPIHTFHLVIDKGAPENLLSFRGEKVKKISSTKFEMITTNFTPTRDIEILILKPVK